MRRLGGLALAALVALGGAAHAACGAAAEPRAEAAARRPVELLPVAFTPIARPVHPVLGSDGRVHLAYEFAVASVSSADVRIVSVEVLDAATRRPSGRNVVVDFDGVDVAGAVSRFDRRGGGPAGDSFRDRLAPGQGGFMYFNVEYPRARDVPCRIVHRVTVAFPDRPDRPAITVDAAPLAVGEEPAIAVAPPLRGPGWFDGDGCCRAIGPHRYTLLTPFGRYRNAESFAIDYVKLSPNGRLYDGDMTVLRNWPSYGEPVYAVADGVVRTAVNDMPDIVPGELPDGITAEGASGNRVVQTLPNGQYALYAHMIPGSVTVRRGDRVREGQMIGRLGNSGNTDAPHLHFQVMSTPSPLDSAGLPFVYRDAVLEGRFRGTPRDVVELGETGGPYPLDRNDAGRVRNRMPLAGDVMRLR